MLLYRRAFTIKAAPAEATPPPAFQIIASIQELMDAIIDPLETRRVLTFVLEVASANPHPEHLVLETL